MKITFENIANLLRHEDIEGLIASGAPSDEYDLEAQKILSALAKMEAKQITAASITAVIALEWAKTFNRSAQEIEQRMPAFLRVTSQILSA